jgi:hypothetical protein
MNTAFIVTLQGGKKHIIRPEPAPPGVAVCEFYSAVASVTREVLQSAGVSILKFTIFHSEQQ